MVGDSDGVADGYALGELVGDGNIAVEERALEAGKVRALIGGGEDVARPVGIGEQALGQRAVREYADALLAAEGQVCCLDVPVEHIVARLVGVEKTRFQGLGHLCGVVVGNADIAGLAGLL